MVVELVVVNSESACARFCVNEGFKLADRQFINNAFKSLSLLHLVLRDAIYQILYFPIVC